MTDTIRMLILDDHFVVRQGLAALLTPRNGMQVVGEPAQKEYALSGRGAVYSYTTVYDPPDGFQAYAPYPVALVKLEEGPMVTAQLTYIAPDDLHTGMPVEMVTRKLSEQGDEGIIQYSSKFRPLHRVMQ